MIFKLLILNVFYLFVVAIEIENRIRGGEFARDGEIPYIVSIRGFNRHICGGSILDSTHILTAAHCVHKYENRSDIFSIQYGVLEISESYPNVVPVKKITKHEDYYDDGGFPHDIAILELGGKIIMGPTVQPVKLPTPFQSPGDDSHAIIAGWGLNQTGGYMLPDLQKVDLIIFPEDICNNSDAYYDSDIHICAGIPKGGKGQCTGDSGGPMHVDGIQYGIVSWSKKPCGSPGHPGYFIKVAYYRNWIRRMSRI